MAGHNTAGLRLTTAEAARLLGLAGRTFARLVESGTFTAVVPARGRKPAEFDAAAVVAAYIGHREARSADLDLAQERAQLARAQREKLELDAAVRRGELVAADAVADRWAEFVDAHREGLLTLSGDAVAAGAITADQERALDDLCRARLTAYADRGGRDA